MNALKRDGYIILPRLFSDEFLDGLARESVQVLETSNTAFKQSRTEKETVVTFSPQSPEARKLLPEESAILRSVDQPLFLDTAKQYLPRGAYVDRVIVHRSHPHPEPVTEWHCDQQREGRLSVKFMLYLNDIDAQNGAFSYVPGSHELVYSVMKKLDLFDVPNTDAHHFTQIRDLALKHGLDSEWPGFKKMMSHIEDDYRSDDHYSLNGRRGSVVIFDTKGMHRGGIVRKGYRDILRVHYFEPEQSAFSTTAWLGKLKRLLS